MYEDGIVPLKAEIAFIYTMNVTEQRMGIAGYPENLATTEMWTSRIFHSRPEIMYACNTYEFTDYSKYRADGWDEKEKARHHETQFPIDCKNAYEAGKRMVAKIRRYK